MMREYQPLQFHQLREGATFHQATGPKERVQLDSLALSVMTDLRQVPAATIDAEAPLDAAIRFMIRRGVRLLLVTDDRREIAGLITATDILGERPVRFALDRGIRRQDLRVRDIMVARERLEILCFDDVAGAKVGHIVATLKRDGRQHALVAHRGSDGRGEMVRGIFSLSQIARQLGLDTPASSEIAQTFAEIEAALRR